MKTNPMEAAFGTDSKKEIDGVVVEYFGFVRVLLARAGGRNAAFQKAHDMRTRPHRQALKQAPETVSKQIQDEIVQDVYLDSVIRGFETNINFGEENQDGSPADPRWENVVILPGEEQPVPANRENLKKYFKAYPDFFLSIINDSQDLGNYRKEQMERDSGN